ncbi:DUF616 domain-containing protein [Salegentibacter sp. F188]|uniref:DUF616 domain-containing protein n=1 Tax=Autumnicola patrickiae TaxID=3075591 RepID=A0ABU3DXM3_9FLAO|nr:glycosyltransferase domain-containing protein [Salegentibacter sp. F188]MDT0688476.1 DUF616 domain-containing protein [Salegentibacter sp. F188]
MSSKTVIYTAIFGNYEGLIPQPQYVGVDYVCFTDTPLKCKFWKVIVVERRFEDPTLDARWHKIMAHKHLSKYKQSIYIDGNFLVLQNPVKLLEQKLRDEIVLAFFDHNQCDDARNCAYEEYQAILNLQDKQGYFKDSPERMQRLITFLKEQKYPENNGLISSGVLMRKHNDAELIKLMEDWWYFVENYTKRDQLSFDYVLWKNNFKRYTYLDGDIRRSNGWFYFLAKHRKNYRFKLFKLKLKKFFNGSADKF